jgi:hypothetical protein
VRVEAPRRAVTLDEVRAHRDAITQLGVRFGMRNIRVFGSVARGEATPDSDLDLLVDVERGQTSGWPTSSKLPRRSPSGSLKAGRRSTATRTRRSCWCT